MTQLNDLGIQTLRLLIFGTGLPLLVLFFLGFVTAFLQAITQIQDQMLSFLPKFVALSIIIYVSFELFFSALVEILQSTLQS